MCLILQSLYLKDKTLSLSSLFNTAHSRLPQAQVLNKWWVGSLLCICDIVSETSHEYPWQKSSCFFLLLSSNYLFNKSFSSLDNMWGTRVTIIEKTMLNKHSLHQGDCHIVRCRKNNQNCEIMTVLLITSGVTWENHFPGVNYWPG